MLYLHQNIKCISFDIIEVFNYKTNYLVIVSIKTLHNITTYVIVAAGVKVLCLKLISVYNFFTQFDTIPGSVNEIANHFLVVHS